MDIWLVQWKRKLEHNKNACSNRRRRHTLKVLNPEDFEAMKTYEKEIHLICKYAMKRFAYSPEFTSGWKMVSFVHDCKKKYIVCKVNSIVWQKPHASIDLEEFLNEYYCIYEDRIGSTPEEAMEKWVNEMIGESLNSALLHIEIAGISIDEDEDVLKKANRKGGITLGNI